MYQFFAFYFVNRKEWASSWNGYNAAEEQRSCTKTGCWTEGINGKIGNIDDNAREFESVATRKDASLTKFNERTDEGGNAAKHNIGHVSTGKQTKYMGTFELTHAIYLSEIRLKSYFYF